MLFSSPQKDMTNNRCNLQIFITKVLLEQRPSHLTSVDDGDLPLKGEGVSREYFRFNASFLPV